MIKVVFTLAIATAFVGCTERLSPFSLPTPEPVFEATDVNQLDVPFEATVSFGAIARVCEAKGKPLGDLVDTASIGDFQIYDTAPEGITIRKFYLTGFSDDCPRQFTASTAAFGTPSMYEALHYGKDTFVYGATDAAYDKIKESICGAPAGEPCGRKIKALDKSTVFVSAYDLTGDSERWTDFLIHDGSVVATALKTTVD
jgi:hypothetical protein